MSDEDVQISSGESDSRSSSVESSAIEDIGEDAVPLRRYEPEPSEYEPESESEREESASKNNKGPSQGVDDRSLIKTEYSSDASTGVRRPVGRPAKRTRDDEDDDEGKDEDEEESEGGNYRRNDRRIKGQPSKFSNAYLGLLNDDIADAAAQYLPIQDDSSDEERNSDGGSQSTLSDASLKDSQIGMTVWTAAEKELLFCALGRLGRDDLAGLATRVRTKTAVEISQYLQLMQTKLDAHRRRRTEIRDGSEQMEAEPLAELFPMDLPAAVEISRRCEAALEDAADAIAVRVERWEEVDERARWNAAGDNGNTADLWLITDANCRGIADHDRDRILATASGEKLDAILALFNARIWLQLSARVFLNSRRPSRSWRCVSADGSPPAIRSTALLDFHTLALSVTRRLVATALWMAEARVRARQPAYAQTRRAVRKVDVEAAARSIGLDAGRERWMRFWAKSARRLRLRVVENDGHDEEYMEYDEVEAALGFEGAGGGGGAATAEMHARSSRLSSSSTSSEEDEEISVEAAEKSGKASTGLTKEEDDSSDTGEEEDSIAEEADDMFDFLGLDCLPTPDTRQVLQERVRQERDEEGLSEALDEFASRREEKHLWEMLGESPPREMDDGLGKSQPRRPRKRQRTNWALAELFPVKEDWRSNLQYRAEWEAERRDAHAGS